MTRRGDVATDTNRFEILLLDVSERRLRHAAARSRARSAAAGAAIRASVSSSGSGSVSGSVIGPANVSVYVPVSSTVDAVRPTADAVPSDAAGLAAPDAVPAFDSIAPLCVLSVLAREDDNDATPAVKDVRWAGNGTLLYRARVNDAPYQAYKLDVTTRRVTQLTHSPHGVLGFDASADLRRLVYIAPVPNPPMASDARSIVVGTQSFWTVHFGQHKFGNQQRRYQFFVTDVGAQQGAGKRGVCKRVRARNGRPRGRRRPWCRQCSRR